MPIYSSIVVPNLIPVALTFEEYKIQHDLQRGRKLPPAPVEKLATSCSMFVDDLCISSCSSVEEIRTKGVENRHLIKTDPRNDEEVALFYHLMLVKRLFYALEQANVMLAPAKLKLHCQDIPHRYLGLEFRGITASMPVKVRELVLNLKRPSSVRETMQVLGLLNFYGNIVKSLRCHSAFLSMKLRKENATAEFEWSDEDEQRWRFLLEIASQAHISGFLALLDPKLRNRCLYLKTDWCREFHSASCVIICKFVDREGKLQCLLCFADSRLLPKSTLASSCCAELAALSYSVAALSSFLQFNPVIAYSDSISLVYLLKRRYDPKLSLNSSVATRLINSLLIF